MSDAHPSFELPVELRFRDIDAYGHVNNAAYLTLLETARVRFIQSHGSPEQLATAFFVVARIEIDFRKPLFLIPAVRVRFRATKIGRSSFTLHYEILDAEDTLYAEALTRIVAVDESKARPAPIPEWFRAIIE